MRQRLKRTLIKALTRWMTPRLRFIYHNPEHWRHAEAHGWQLLPKHFYQPIPDTAELEKTYPRVSSMAGIDWNEAAQLRLAREVFPKYAAEYAQFHADFVNRESSKNLTLEFVGHDPYVYYCMLRHFQPRRVIEIGAGFSTLVACHAAARNKNTAVIAIEPYPGDWLREVENDIELLRQGAQETEMALFDSLEANDILFIDSSHVVKMGSDVCHLVLEVLPRLRSGVLAHFHDIFLPHDYPLDWLLRRVFWSEQYLLQAYLIHNQRMRILFANHYMNARHGQLMRQTFPESDRVGGGSLWLQVAD